jgi:hypothetical protein
VSHIWQQSPARRWASLAAISNRSKERRVMAHTNNRDMVLTRPGPHASSSLVPMLVSGLVLIVIGMIVAYAVS